MPKNLADLLSPKSVAVIGASRSPEKVGAIVLQNIIEAKFTGKIYAVNPNTDSIGEIKCFKTVLDLPEIVDLAIVTIPSHFVMATMQQLADKGIKNVVVLSAGFKETGHDGVELEKQLKELCEKNAINMIGPNCLGYVNNDCPINATFARTPHQSGNLRFISQSGALATSLFDWFSSVNVGFSEFITLGNKTIINENDILEYYLDKSQGPINTLMQEHSKVEPIGMYLESIVDGQKFISLAKQLTKTNPIFIIKPGKTKAAATAMQSHTGAIAGADDILDVALSQAGVYRCQTLEEFFDLSKAYAWNNLPEGPRVAIISNAGGPGVISADAIVTEGLAMAEFDEETVKKLYEVLPRSASVGDPIDVLGDALADRFAYAAEIVLQTNKCDSILVILTPQMMTQIKTTAEVIGEVSKKYHKPIFCAFIGGTMISEGEKALDDLKVPSYLFPERAIKVISAMWDYKKQQKKLLEELPDIRILNKNILPDSCNEILQKAIKNNQNALDNIEANDVMTAAYIPTPATKIASSLADAKEFAQKNSYPVVLKLSSPGLLHKKHFGGVILGIRNDEELEDGWSTLERKVENLEAPIKAHVQVQIQKEIPSGAEVLVGLKKDPTFGEVLLFGAGGSLAELISDKNLHLLPVDLASIEELVKGSKIYKVLKGNDQEPAYALDKLYKLIFNLCHIFQAAPQIQGIEINPVIININDVWAVDPKVILEAEKATTKGPKYKVATTLKAEKFTSKLRYFEFGAEVPFELQAGQYISVKVSDTRINCYSVAGHNGPSKFNLLVDITPGGPGSKFFEALKADDKITYLGPFGTFTLKPNDGSTTMLFLATGAGLAPLKPMIEQTLSGDVNKKVVLYMGVNDYEDIFMTAYLDSLTKKYKNFSYKISVCNKNDKWNGPCGFITAEVKKDFANAKDCSAYLCGNKFMIADATKMLVENGCAENRIYFEKI